MIFNYYYYGITVRNDDGYVSNFIIFNNGNVYNEIVKGTSVLYMLVLKFFNFFTGNVNASFFSVNLISYFVLTYVSYKILIYRNVNINKFIYISCILLFFNRFLLLSLQTSAYSDSFLSVFIALILKVLLVDIKSEENISYKNLLKIGFFFGLALSVRKSAVLILPIIFIVLFIKRSSFKFNLEFLKKIRKEGVHPSVEEHIKIVNALEQRNPDKARTAMKVHIESSTDNAAEHFGRDA